MPPTLRDPWRRIARFRISSQGVILDDGRPPTKVSRCGDAGGRAAAASINVFVDVTWTQPAAHRPTRRMTESASDSTASVLESGSFLLVPAVKSAIDGIVIGGPYTIGREA